MIFSVNCYTSNTGLHQNPINVTCQRQNTSTDINTLFPYCAFFLRIFCTERIKFVNVLTNYRIQRPFETSSDSLLIYSVSSYTISRTFFLSSFRFSYSSLPLFYEQILFLPWISHPIFFLTSSSYLHLGFPIRFYLCFSTIFCLCLEFLNLDPF